MRIALTTVGSTGDTQPYIALALRLMEAGHEVRVCSHPFHEDRFTSRGIDYVGCGPVVSQQDLNEMLDKMLRSRNPVRQLRLLMEGAFFEEGEKYFAQCKEATQGYDLAVCHMVDFLGQEAVTQNGIPRIGVILAPAAIPSRQAPPPRAPDIPLIYPLEWSIMSWLLAPVDRRAMRYLRGLGGTVQDVRRFSSHSPDLNLIAASPLICPIHPDLPAHFKVCGHWPLAEPEFSPPDELRYFLERHPRPVVVSFGSMGGTRGQALTRKLLESVRIAGLPAVIQSGYAGLFADSAPENVHFADYVPHDWLFSRGSCVVHHGGAGTTHAACRAGVPSVVMAFFADQPYFAQNLRQLGIAPDMLWHYHFSPQRLARRIREAAESASMQEKARALGEQLRQEDGLGQAVSIIERQGAKIVETERARP